MRTEHFEEGTFWLLVDTPPHLLWPAVLGFGAVVLGYSTTIIRLLTRANRKVPTRRSFDTMIKNTVTRAAGDKRRSRITSSTAKLVVSFVETESPRRTRLNVCLKVGDLMVESLLLLTILEAGPPVQLAAIFMTIVVANALSCIVMMNSSSSNVGLTETLVDIFFDFLIAAGYPMIVLSYCLSTFKFDYRRLAINLQVFPIGAFEQSASLVANPVQMDIIHQSLRLLRVASVMDIFARVGVNLVFCFRLYGVASRLQYPDYFFPGVYPKHHRAATGALTAFILILIIFVEESIRTSAAACSPHPECVVKAHRWTVWGSGSLTQCPCLTFIDGDIAPKTYNEWMNPRNVSEKLAHLAALGDLQTIQLVNRLLPTFPDELRRCTKMAHLYVANIGNPHCMVHPLWGTPAASCLPANRTDDRPTPGTLTVLKKYSHSICGGLILPGTVEGPPTPAGMEQCNGTLYRQCVVPGFREAMCYSARFMGIACSVNPYPIEMRRRQIQAGVGDHCNPVDEEWLGCKRR
ncbi:hypothetical protein ON010_g6400 [Phytophthora cinnamomi]|nr:hypothetical protein ON010_g6400 [Phytophthora cinnamomi]